jgi:hypothetical protein
MGRASGLSQLLSPLGRHAFALALLLALLAGAWLRWDALGLGFHSDDHTQIGMLRGKFAAPRGPLDLFRLADGPRDGKALLDQGYLPWWSHPELKLAMFRPLSSALFALDHRVFGENPLPWHVHSFVWWVLTMLVCALLFRAVLPARVAVIALFLFAIEEAHTVPVAWLANRNTLVSSVFGLLGVWLHVRFRKERRPVHGVAEGAALVLALAGGEHAVAVLAYVAAYELFVDDGLRGRVRALVPALAAFAAYVVARAAFGYGVSHSGYYISPAESPARFVMAAVERVPILIGDLIAGLPAVWWSVGVPWTPNFEQGKNWLSFLGTLGLVGFIVVAIRLSARNPQYASLRWLCAGAVISVFPGAGALPEDRTLVAATVGASAVLAAVIVSGFDALRELYRTRAPSQAMLVWIGLAGGVLYVHGYKAWVRSADQIHWLGVTIRAQRRWALEARIPDAGVESRRVILVSAADFTTNANLPWVRLVANHPVPRSYWRMSGAVAGHIIKRTAPNELELEPLTDRLDRTMVGSLYRSDDAGFQVGDTVTLDGMRVEVLSTIGPHPFRTKHTFERSLDDPSYLFIASTPGGVRPFSLPPVGGTLETPPPVGARP